MIPSFTVVTGTVVILVCTIVNNYVADVVLLSLAEFANLVAYVTGSSVVYFAVCDLRTALVVGDFNVVSLAVAARSSTLLVYAVVNCRDTHVHILCKVLPVEAFQAVAVAVVVVAIGDCGYTAAICS